MDSTCKLDDILRHKVVAVIRGDDPELLGDLTEALVEGGIRLLEVTFTIPRATSVIERLNEQFQGRAMIGAGTVLDAETARAAILTGAQFVVGPNTDPEMIALCRRYSIPVMPGAFTPTEIVRAWQAGADIVKIFPAELGGPRYFKTLQGPLPQVRLMPTGGVNLNTIGEFLNAGAVALGVGSALVDPQLVKSRDWTELQRRATQYAQVIQEFHSDAEQAS